MQKFNDFFKNKKLVVAPALVLVIISLLVPQGVSAQAACPFETSGIFAIFCLWQWLVAPISESWTKFLADVLVQLGILIINIAGSALLGVVSVFIGLIAVAVGVITGLVNGVLMEMIRVSLTASIINDPVIQEMWQFSRDFVNLIFILILAFIGLATILRLETYVYKRTLANLLIIALLVNFSLVLVGFIVDMGSILTNFFFTAFAINGTGGIFEAWELAWNYLIEAVNNMGRFIGGSLGTFPLFYFVGYLSHGIAIILYFLFATGALLLAALLLFFRVIALWVLAITAPFAFAAFILPSTRQYYNLWMKQLVQWSFIGVILGFFLYLGSNFTARVQPPPPLPIEAGSFFQESASTTVLYSYETTIVIATSTQVGQRYTTSTTMFGGSSATSMPGFLNAALTPFIGLIFFYIGSAAAMQFAPMGAERLMGFGQQASAAARAAVTKRAVPWARQRIPKGVTKAAGRLATTPTWGAGEKTRRGKIKRVLGAPAGWALRSVGQAGLSLTAEAEKKDAAVAYREAEGRDLKGNAAAFRQARSDAERAKILQSMAEKGQLKDFLNPEKAGKGKELTKELTKREMMDAYKRSVRLGDKDAISAIETSYRGMPIDEKLTEEEQTQLGNQREKELADVKDAETSGSPDATSGGLTKKEQTEFKNLTEKIIKEAGESLEKMKMLSKGWWNSSELMEAANLFWKGHQAADAARTFGSQFTDSLQEFAQKHGTNWYFAIDEKTDPGTQKKTRKIRNADIPRFLASTSAMGLTLPLEGAETPEKVNRLTEEARIYRQLSGQQADTIKTFDAKQKEIKEVVATLTKGGLSAQEIAKFQTQLQTLKTDAQNLSKVIEAESKLKDGWEKIEKIRIEEEWEELREKRRKEKVKKARGNP